ncbi:thioredoxin domain-containing protein [Thermosulfuriphilus sp.]
MSNLFSQKAKSLYLRRHLHDPVRWWPWTEEAFYQALQEDKPVFLSIGYAACHWCQVMHRDCFQDEEIAALLNEQFIPIKVDREERPDIDSLYMRACLLLTGGAGWPLSVFLTPEKWPFMAGTYFPKRGSGNRPGFAEILRAVATAWTKDKERLRASARQILKDLMPEVAKASELPGRDIFSLALEAIEASFDWRYGGLKGSPKFPMPSVLYFLAQAYRRLAQPIALEMLEKTLLFMRLGGIYDHLGHGFHRYSVDAAWHVPHFEKMLYDQALISLAYLEAYELTGKSFYAQVVREIFDYVERELSLEDGSLASSQDAETQGREGWYYLWTKEEIRDLLGRELGELFCRVYNIQTEGNFLDPVKGYRTGRNIIFLRAPLSQLIRELGLSRSQIKALDEAKLRLLAARKRRPSPAIDNKVITSWNAMMAKAFFRAARLFRERDFADQGQKILASILNEPLFHCQIEGTITAQGLLEDYAWIILALLEAEKVGVALEKELKERLSQEMISRFFKDGCFYLSEAQDLPCLVHDDYDGAIPSAASAATLALASLKEEAPSLLEVARQSLLGELPLIKLDLPGHTFWLKALAKLI